MARPDFEDSTTTRTQWNGSVDWLNSKGDWWDSAASAQGSSPWATATITDTDSEKDVTWDVTSLFQAIYDNPNHVSGVMLRVVSGTGVGFLQKTDATASKRPKISYDGGAAQECTESVILESSSFGGVLTTNYVINNGDGNMLIEFPAPSSRPTSATMTLRTAQQYGNCDVQVMWLRYPSESAPTLGGPPDAPSGVTAGSITPTSASISWTDNSSDETGFKVQTAPSPYSSWTAASGSPAAANATSLSVTGLTDGVTYKARVAATNANGDSAWVESGTFTTLSLTRLRPNADTTVGTATSTGANLYGVIDEVSADDGDYITIPGTLTSVSLVQGHPSETNIKTWTPTLGGSFALSSLTMTSGEASAITDYGALYMKIVTSSTTVKLKFETSTDPGDDNYHSLQLRARQA
jgi:hypothetical protein